MLKSKLRTLRRAIWAIPLWAVATGAVAGKSSDSDDPAWFEPDSAPYGVAFKEWTARLWQAATSAPAAVNPVTDTTGGNCMVAQSGPVWYLYGTFGGTASRSCTIPGPKALLFPVLNATPFDSPDVCGQGSESMSINLMRTYAATITEGPPQLSVELDGESIPNLLRFRQRSVPFGITLPPSNLYSAPCGGEVPAATYPAVDDGYYVMLRPLPPGPHQLRIRASTPSGFGVDVSYALNVLPLRLK